jgi:hypothetical protein
MATVLANYGRLKEADTILNRVEDMRIRSQDDSSDAMLADLWRRRAQIRRSSRDARIAVSLSRPLGNPYSINTALLFDAWVRLSGGDTHGARDVFEAIASEPVTWAYLADAMFGLACCRIAGDGHTMGAVESLVQAQYLYVVLGVQPTPHPGLPFRGIQHLSDVMPGDILMRILEDEHTKREKCLALRREALERIVETVCMVSTEALPPPSESAHLSRRESVSAVGTSHDL